ncbi:MAG: MNIO family bufferin maturase [Alphaproteobacteria bacterium]
MAFLKNILPVPANSVGIGLRSSHYEEIIETKPNIGWLEIHPENYFCGGAHKYFLDKISAHYPLSMHAVGLSLGADQNVDIGHLARLKALVDRYDPIMVSDHIAWSASGNAHLNDLLPLPYTCESLRRVGNNINQVQEALGRCILVENPSTYIAFKDNDMSEPEFMNAVCKATGCGMILDVNNIYVQGHNHGIDPRSYIDAIDVNFVGELHLAGHIEKKFGAHSLLIDSHNRRICDDVWDLYDYAIRKTGLAPTLIEWDQDVPPLKTLLGEAQKAQIIIQKHGELCATE